MGARAHREIRTFVHTRSRFARQFPIDGLPAEEYTAAAVGRGERRF